jgi:hypothetical protein
MTGKKIEFLKKPSKHNSENFIDNWVSGVGAHAPIIKNLKRTTIYLPEDLRQELKLLALKENTTMTELIITALEKQLKI